MQCIKYQLEELGILNTCDFCFNGEETVRLVQARVEAALSQIALDPSSDRVKRITPVKLMLLDFQMPRMNGIQVVEHVRKYISDRNTGLEHAWVCEPRFVFLTAFKTKQFKQHVKKLGITEVHDKPLQIELLREFVFGNNDD